MKPMTVDESEARLNQLLREAGFDFNRPDPAAAWEVFKRFSAEPVGCYDESLFFEAADGRPDDGTPGYFDFVREYLVDDGEGGAEYHEHLTVQFNNQPSDPLGITSGSIDSSNFPDREAFFRAVEQSPAFQKGLAFKRWAVEVRVDAV